MKFELHRKLIHPTELPIMLPNELFKIRERRQYSDHYATLAKLTSRSMESMKDTLTLHNTMTTASTRSKSDTGSSPEKNHTLGGSPTHSNFSSTENKGTLGGTKNTLIGGMDTFATPHLDTTMMIANLPQFEVSKEIKDRLAVTPFTRMVILLAYKDQDTLDVLNAAIKKVLYVY